MAITYKDIDLLTQKSAVVGTEKIPVSDTNFVTPDQIAVLKRVYLEDEEDMPVSPDANTLYLIKATNTVVSIVYLEDESDMPASPDSNTLYLIKEEE